MSVVRLAGFLRENALDGNAALLQKNGCHLLGQRDLLAGQELIVLPQTEATFIALAEEALFKYHDPQFSSNPYSRWQQKRAIKKEYMAAKAGSSAGGTAKASEIAAKATKKSAEGTKKVSQFFAKNKKTFLLIGGLAVMLAFLLNVMSSCSIITQSTISAFGSTTYPVEDSDMRAAEAQYCALEAELQEYLDT